MKTLARASLVNLTARLIAVALGLALTIYTARLGTAAQGTVALFLAVESVLLAMGTGLGVALARRVSHHGESPAILAPDTVLQCLALGGLTAVALWLLARTAGEGYGALAWLAIAAPLMFLPSNLSGLWLGLGRMRPLAVLMVAAPLLVLIALGVQQVVPIEGLPAGTVVSVLAAWVVARLLVALGSLWACWRAGWLPRPAGPAAVRWPQRLSRDFRFVAVIGATNVLSLLNYKVDLFLVERFMGLEATGVYSIAVAVAELLWLVSSAVTTAAYARIGQPDRDAATALALRAMRSSVALLLVLSPVLWLLAAGLIPWLLGAAYAPAAQALAWLLPGVVLYGAASALSAWFTNHAGRPEVPASLATLSLVVTAVLSWWAIPRWGLAGAASATSVGYTTAMVLGAILFRRMSGLGWAAMLRGARDNRNLCEPG